MVRDWSGFAGREEYGACLPRKLTYASCSAGRNWPSVLRTAGREPAMTKRETKDLEELQNALLGLHDELTETYAWTALLYDGLCGLVADQTPDVDSVTHTGMRFAAIWLKKRNRGHAAELQAACSRLCEIRERQKQLRSGRPHLRVSARRSRRS